MCRLLCAAALSLLAILPCHAEPALYLVVHEDAGGQLALTYHSKVDLAAVPKIAASSDWDGHGNRLERRLAGRILRNGVVQYQSDFATSRWLRGEFHALADGGGSDIDAHYTKLNEYDYVLRIPASSGSRLQLDHPGNGFASAGRLEIDLDHLPPMPTNRFADSTTIPLVQNGDPANRLDLLILAEGYTADQQGKFQQDAKNMIESFLALSPYKDYRNLINATGLFLVSAQAGASKPACAETPSEPVINVNTALGAKFCTNGSRRVVTVDTSKAYAAAANVPNWDKLMVLVNDSEYGGSGGPVIVMTTNSSVVQLAQHEFGHSFTLLADEYSAPYPGYPSCSDATGSRQPCETNVTNNLTSLKWKGWLDNGTPVPSSIALSDPIAAGAWEGARYLSNGMYRQCYSGIMRSFSTPFFCHVDAEAFATRLYSAGWGTPSQGINNIEPKTTQPSSTNVIAMAGDTVNFKAVVVGPDTALSATWAVDGTAQKSETPADGGTISFDYPATAGNHTVTLTVTDASPLLLTKKVSTQNWQISVSAYKSPNPTNKADSERLMDWAEHSYPQFFSPAGTSTQTIGGYQARYYSDTQTYLGILNGRVHLYGTAFGGLLDVGLVSDFMPLVSDAGY